jgi:L-ascorbate metabolism protein UlaG (beta-lactamase superfamily)
MLIKPVQQHEPLAREIREAKKQGRTDAFDIWWLGQSGFLIQWNRSCLLFDPYLSDSLRKKYANTAKPHVRMSELVIEPHLLDMIDVATSSHNHTDHLDADTLQPLLRVNRQMQFVIPEANREFVCERVKCAPTFPIGLTDGESVSVGPWQITGVPAAHNTIERDAQGRCKFMGFVVRFGEFCLYHSGDTLWYDGMVELLRPHQVDLAFLPINGNVPSRGVAGNLDAREAAQLGKEIGARLVVPHHYDLFEFNTADPIDFEKFCQEYGQPYRVMKLGEHLVYA